MSTPGQRNPSSFNCPISWMSRRSRHRNWASGRCGKEGPDNGGCRHQFSQAVSRPADSPFGGIRPRSPPRFNGTFPRWRCGACAAHVGEVLLYSPPSLRVEPGNLAGIRNAAIAAVASRVRGKANPMRSRKPGDKQQEGAGRSQCPDNQNRDEALGSALRQLRSASKNKKTATGVCVLEGGLSVAFARNLAAPKAAGVGREFG